MTNDETAAALNEMRRRTELAAEIAEAVIARLREDDRLREPAGEPFTQSNMDGLVETVLAVMAVMR